MDSIDEKRVYSEREDVTTVFVASGVGVVRVRVSGASIGEFGLIERCETRDIATGGGSLAVATPDDVLVCSLENADLSLEGTKFGSPVAVGYDDETLLAGNEAGRISRLDESTTTWQAIPFATRSDDAAPLECRAIDGPLVGTRDGVYRHHGGHLVDGGLSDVVDVSAAGVPLAATADGLYKLGNGWMVVLEESTTMVRAAPESKPGRLARAHAMTADGDLYEHDGKSGTWERVTPSSGRVVDVAYGETTYAVTEDGTLLVRDGTTWRSQALGVGAVVGLACVGDA